MTIPNPNQTNSGYGTGGNTNKGGPDSSFAGSSPLINDHANYDEMASAASTFATGSFDERQPNINALLQPPTLGTFIYAPNIRIVIGHVNALGVTMQYDVSADLVNFQLIRPENSAATFIFTLQNRGLRYTPPGQPPFFSRMDRIVVYMYKTAWVQTFSGYIDTVPYKQLYPGPVQFKATCTIKRLMHTWINPALPATQNIFAQFADGAQMVSGDGTAGSTDSGIGNLLEALLTLVGNWSPTNIHIQNFPLNFWNFINQQLARYSQQNQNNQQDLKTMILGSNTSPGPGSYAGMPSTAGTPGPYAPTGTGDVPIAGTTFYMEQIIAACDNHGQGPLAEANDVAASLIQAGDTGETDESGGMTHDDANNKAWEQITQTGKQLQDHDKDSDGAILATACAMALTGAGVTIRNQANVAAIGSTNFPNDGLSTMGSGCGIFLMQNSWGPAQVRMNPKQAANMWFSALSNIPGWRSMDGGQVCAQIMQDSNAVAYDAAIKLATQMVQGFRTSGGAEAASVADDGVPGTSIGTDTLGGSLSAGLAAPSSITGGTRTVGGATSVPAPGSVLGVVNPTTSSSPQPNSEGAINFMKTCLGLPYVWGAKGPAAYDCSGLMEMGFKAIGLDIGASTYEQAAQVPSVPISSAQRGDMIQVENGGHTFMWMGDGTIIEAAQSGIPIHHVPNPYPTSSWSGVYRACLNGGPNPSAPFNSPFGMGPGVPPSAVDQVGGLGGTGAGPASEGIARNLFSYMFQPQQFANATAMMFQGEKAFIEGEPLLQMVQAVASAGLRSWSSAPNGDFIAWYPDYFGLDGKPAVLALSDIELKDCTINFSDDALTTHVYVNGDFLHGLSSDSPEHQLDGWLTTSGVATVEDEWLFQRITAVAPSDIGNLSGTEIMYKFGVRPLSQTFSMAGDPSLELMLAIYVFQQKWAQQFQTTISMTFMPELFPGMRIELIGHNLQAYVSSVSHSGDYVQGFSTQATIIAPSNPMGKFLMDTVNSAEGPSQYIQNAFGEQNGFNSGQSVGGTS